MFNFKKRPYNLLLLTSVLIFIASFFVLNETFDIHWHDTYFIIALPHLFWGTIILLLTLWTICLSTYRFLFSKYLTWAHIILTVAASVLLVAVSSYSNNYYHGLAGMPRRYYDYGSWGALLKYNNSAKGVLIASLLLAVGLLAQIANLAVGLFYYFPRKT